MRLIEDEIFVVINIVPFNISQLECLDLVLGYQQLFLFQIIYF